MLLGSITLGEIFVFSPRNSLLMASFKTIRNLCDSLFVSEFKADNCSMLFYPSPYTRLPAENQFSTVPVELLFVVPLTLKSF